MEKTKSRLLCVLIATLLILSVGVFFACGKKEEPISITVVGNGVVTTIEENNSKYYLAEADDWHLFVGWFNKNRRISTDTKLLITQSLPREIEARFETSGVLTLNRVLNSLYNTYDEGYNKTGKYFNLNSIGEFKFQDGQSTSTSDINLNGFINFEGEGSQFTLDASGDKNFSLVYCDNRQDGKVYVDDNGEKIAYPYFGLLTNILKEMPSPQEGSWNLESIIKDDVYKIVNQYIGYYNLYGVVENAKNDENNSVFQISFHKYLNTLKSVYATLESGSQTKKMADILVGNYLNSTVPNIIIKLEVNYSNLDKEQIDNLKISFSVSKDYNLNYGDGLTIPASNFSYNFKQIKYGFSDEANKFEDGDKYSESEFNFANVRICGNMSFLSGEKDVIDSYKIELNSDLNPFALLAFKGEEENYNDIEWEKLGFLSLKITLIEAEDDLSIKRQEAIHNGGKEYLYMVLDTKNYGPNLYIYSELFNPNSLLTTSNYLNNVYNLPELLNYIKVKNNNQSSFASDALKLFGGLIEFCLNFDAKDVNGSFYKLASKLLEESGLNQYLTLEENCVQLELKPVRSYIQDGIKDLGITTDDFIPPIDQYMFGKEKDVFYFGRDEIPYDIKYLTFDFEEGQKNCVTKDEKGDYLDENGQVIFDDYNQRHITLTSIEELNLKESYSIKELEALKGKTLTALSGVFSDGSSSSTYLSNKNKQEEIVLDVLDIKILKNENGKISVKFYLSLHDSLSGKYDPYTVGGILYKNFKIPYGLFVFSSTVNEKEENPS